MCARARAVHDTSQASERNTYTKKVNVFRQNQPNVIFVPMQIHGSREKRPKKNLQMCNHKFNKNDRSHMPTYWPILQENVSTKQTKQYLYTFCNYSQESKRSNSKPCEHICCSLYGSVQQKYKKMAVAQLLIGSSLHTSSSSQQ